MPYLIDSNQNIENVFGHFRTINKIALLMKITFNCPYTGLDYQSNHILLHLLLLLHTCFPKNIKLFGNLG